MRIFLNAYKPYLKAHRLHFLFVFIGIIFTVASELAQIELMKYIIDEMFIEKKPAMLYLVPLGIIVIFIAAGIGRYIQSVFTNVIGLDIITTLRNDTVEKLLHMPMQFHHEQRSGELISRITNDIARIQYFVSSMLPEILRELLIVIGMIGYAIYLSPLLSFYSLVILPLTYYPLTRIAKRLKKLSHRAQEKNADVLSRLTEIFNNQEMIAASSTQPFESKRFRNVNGEFLRVSLKSVYINELISPFLSIAGALGIAAMIYFGGKAVYTGAMSSGEFIAFLLAIGKLFQPIRRIGSIYGKIQDAKAASERIFEILHLTNPMKNGTTALQAPITDIAFKQCTLAYNQTTKALDAITLQVNTTQIIALVGDSGGGKSSLMNLLLRFYDPTKGELHLNGLPLQTYDIATVRAQIAYVSQRVYIMQGTLAQNVAYGIEVDEKKVTQALKQADAMAFVTQLEQGIHTPLLENGANLSGGQRQRIAIARAIYKNASVLILDEATSALDNESERRIQEALNALEKNKITFIIAHRLNTIEHADRILLFQQGKIVEEGTHTHLLQHSKLYQRLAGQMQ